MTRTRTPTIIDVARQAGVSKSAVSRVLSGAKGDSLETQRKVRQAALELGYVANAVAQRLVGARTGTIGVVVRDIRRPIYNHLQSALQSQASQRGLRVVATSGSDELDVAEERRAMQTLVSLQVEGLIVCSGVLPVDDIVPFASRIPIVVAGRPEYHPELNSVFTDEDKAAERLVDHIVSLGHRRVAVLQWPLRTSIPQHVRAGRMIAHLHTHGVDVDVVSVDRDYDRQSALAGILERGATAIMCPSDTQAVDMIATLAERGMSVPESVSVTGFDGLARHEFSPLSLTTVRQDLGGIAAAAVARVAEGFSSEPVAHLAIEGELRVGDTTAPPN